MADEIKKASEMEPEEETPRETGIVCQFCHSRLTKRGEVLEMSPKAKKLRDATDEMERLQAQIEAEKQRTANVETELKNLRDSLDVEAGIKQPRLEKPEKPARRFLY